MLITNSARYGLTQGSYNAEWISLTNLGRIASEPGPRNEAKLRAQFKLAVENIPPFNLLYTQYKSKKLPSREVMRDVLTEGEGAVPDPAECVDLFIVNVKYLGLLDTVAGSEMLLPLEHVLERIPADSHLPTKPEPASANEASALSAEGIDWTRTCFYVTPIGDDGTEIRKHSDLFLSAIVEPALKELGLRVVRADQIGKSGMITSQVLEHVLRSALVVVDLSWHNPNVFYEMALRHATKRPVIQIIRKLDKLPFDVNQVRTVEIDTSDIYTLVPRIETYRSEIASHARAAINEAGNVSNPLTVFFPGFGVTMPS